MNASFRLSALALALASVSSQAAEPASDQLPSGGQVQAGQANISQSGHQLTVTQSSDRAVIDWQSFDVGSDAQVHFDQPSVSSATLNRVLSSNPTQVMGRITAPGQVFLVNPNGVLFGPNSQVDVGGLAASTLDIDNTDFMAGDLRFHSGAGSGSIISQGEIETTLGGFVALLAPEVINEGLIVAPYGRVAMAAGERIEIDLDGQGRWVQVEPALVDTLIENRHAIEVNAGQILLSSRAVNELARGVIRQSGTLTANSMVQSGGRILLEGDDIRLSSSAQIQANGALGGGDVLIGGDWQGGQNAERRVFDNPNTLHQADTVRMEAGASIQANATDNGDGGTVVLWSDIRRSGGSTRAYGQIQAQGGPNGGDGGQVETSGAYLDVAGISVSTLATAGASGVWLLDPANITLGGSGDSGSIPGSEGPSTDTNLDEITVAAALQSGNVEIYTGDAGSGTASITMAGGTKWNFQDSDGHSLTLRAHNTINISGELRNAGGIHLIADNIVIGTTGQNADVAVTYDSADLTMTAADYIMTNDSISLQTQGGDIVLWSDSDNSGQGHIRLGTTNTIRSNGGDIILAGGEDTNSDSRPDGYAVTSGANSKPGVQLGTDGTRVELISSGGDIIVRGEHNSTSATGQGVTLTRDITMNAGTGAIEIEGRSNNGIGIDFGTATPSMTYSIVSAKTSGTAIRIVGAQTATTSTSNVAIRSAMSGSFSPNIASTGGGDVIIQGTNSTSATTDALALGNMQIQASAGNISIDGGTQGISFGAGSRAGAGTLVSSSTADVTIRADRLNLKSLSVSAGDLSLVSSSDSFTSLTLPTAAMQVSDYTIGSITNTLALTLQNSIGSGSSVIRGGVSIYAGDLTIKDGLTIAAYSGFDVLASSSGNFTNLAGSNAISTSGGGRWLVFAADAVGNTYGSLDSENQAIWGEDVSTLDASSVSGNRYVFGALTGQTVAPLTVTSTDVSKVYGTVADLSNSYTISGGYVNGVDNVYQGTTPTNYELSDLYSVNPTISSTLAAADANVGTAAITISGGTLLSNLSVTTADAGTLTVTPRALVLTADDRTKTYGETLTLGSTAYTVSSGTVASGDAITGVTLGSANNHASTLTSNVATYSDEITIGAATGTGGFNSTNYAITYTAGDLTVNPANLTLSGSRVYDGTTVIDGSELTATGVNGETFTVIGSGDASNLASANVQTGSALATLTGLSLGTSSNGGSSMNYNALATVGSDFDVTARAITLTADDRAKTYGDNLTLGSTAYTVSSGTVASGDAITGVTLGSANSHASTLTSHAAAYRNEITISAATGTGGFNSTNYAITYAAGDLTVNPADLTLSGSRVYDGTTVIDGSALTATGVNGETFTVTGSGDASNLVSANVQTGSTLATLTGLSLGTSSNGGLSTNYNALATTGSDFDVTARAITLTADSVSQIYGDSDATLSVTASSNSLVTGDTLAEVTGTLTREAGSDVGSYDIELGTGSKASNYNITFATDNDAYQITRRSLTLTGLTVSDKTYNRDTDATVSSWGSFSNVVGDDQVSLNVDSASVAFDDRNYGTQNVTITGLSLDGTDATNYSIADQTSTATINKFELDLGLTANDKVYDGDADAVVTAAPNVFTGDSVSVTFDAAFSNENVADNKIISLTNLSLTGTDSGNYLLPTTPSVTANITARPLTLTYTAENRIYNGDVDATVSFTDNRIDGDVLTVSQTAAFSDKHVGDGKTVTLSDINLGGQDASNYSLQTPTNPTANITERDLTLTYTGTNRVYDGSTNASVSVNDDRVANDQLTITQTAAFSDKNFGTGKTITLSNVDVSGPDAANYNVLPPTNPTADITKRSLTVTVDASNKVYDGNNTASVTYQDNRVLNDVFDVTGTAVFDNKRFGLGKSVTVSNISISGTDADNYTVNTSASDTADITKRTLTLTLTGDNRVYDGTTDATISALDDRISGDNIALDYTAAFIDKHVGDGKTINVTGISLLGTDADNYSVVSSDSTTGNITARALNFTVTAQDKVYDQSDVAQVTIDDDRVAEDDLSPSFTASFSDDQFGENKAVSINSFVLNGTDAGNYSYTAPTSTTASITKRTLNLTVDADDKVYDGTQSATVTVTDDRLSGDTLSYTYNAQFADKNVGTGKAVQLAGLTLTDVDAINYQLPANAAGSASITARTLNITANPINRVYDGTRAVNVSYSDDRIAGDDFSISATALMTDKLAGANKSVALSNLALSGTDAGNYAATVASLGLVDIDRRTLAVSADAKDKNYDATRIALVDLTDDRISGDQLSLAYSALFENAQAGTNKLVDLLSLNLSGSDAPNYRLGSLPLGLRADIVNQQANNLVFAPVKEPESSLSPDMDPEKDILQIDQGLIAVSLPEPPKVETGPISVEVIAEPDVEFNGMVVVTMDLEKVESARFALPSSIRQLKPVGVQASAELRGGAPLPEWLSFNPDTMEFEALGNAQLDAPMQVDLVFGQYRLSVLVLPEELEAL